MIDYPALYRERYSSALISDAAFRAGVPVRVPPSGLAPRDPHSKLAGPAVTLQCNNDLAAMLGALHRAEAGEVIVVANVTYEVALLGDLIGSEAKRKGLAGFVVDGLVRDTLELIELGLPVVSRGAIPIGPIKLPDDVKGIGHANVEIALGRATVRPGDWVFSDADGVVFVDADDLPAIYEWAAKSWEREAAMTEAIRGGTPLGDLVDIEGYLAKRATNPGLSLDEHIAGLNRAI